jgi:hypothetical protein
MSLHESLPAFQTPQEHMSPSFFFPSRSERIFLG